MKRYCRAILLAALALLVAALPVLASYSVPITVANTSATAYTMLPVIVTSNNTFLAANGYMASTANDTRITSGGSTLAHMIADNYTLFAAGFPANSATTVTLTTNNTGQAMSIVTGYGGYFTSPTAAPSGLVTPSFNLTMSGYFDMSAANYGFAYAAGGGGNSINVSASAANVLKAQFAANSTTVSGVTTGNHTVQVSISGEC